MATKSDFTEQEWEQLRKGVTGAGLIVSLSDHRFLDSFKEAGALAKHMAAARKVSQSVLVRDLADEHGTGFGLTDKPDQVKRETIEALRAATSTLQAKAPDELDAYRSFVTDVARSVGDAASGGDAAEGSAIEEIRTAMTAAR